MNNSIILGLLVLVIGISTMHVFAESNDVPEITLVPSTPLIMLDDPLSDEFDEIDHNNNIVPSLTIERENNIIYLTWDNIRTTDNIYDILVIEEGVTSKVTSVEISTSGSGVAYYDTHTYYNKLTNADSIGVGGTVDGLSIDIVFMTVPPITPIIIVERLDDYSLKVIWENIPIDANFYFITIPLSNGSESLIINNTGQSYHIFDTNSSDPYSIALFNRVNNAARIGVAGVFDNGIGTMTYVPVPNPTLTADRDGDNSIKLTWTNMPTTSSLGYNIHIIESNGTDALLFTHEHQYHNSYTIRNTSSLPDHIALFNRVNNAEQVGVSGFIDDKPGHVTYVPIPPPYSSPIPPPNSSYVTPFLNNIYFDEFDGIRASCSDPTLNSNNDSPNSITVKSKPLKIPSIPPPGTVIYSMGPGLACILPSSISVQVPDRVQIGEIFNVTVTPSFELTHQQIDEYNRYRTSVNDARTIWDNVCRDRDGHYRVTHPVNYEPSGDNISYSENHIKFYSDTRYEIHTSKLKGLNFDGESTTFQMSICKDPVYLASNSNDRKNSDHLKHDFGYFYIDSNSKNVALTPVGIYTSIDGDSVILSGNEFWWSPLSDFFVWGHYYFVQLLHILYTPIFHLHTFLESFPFS